MTILERILSEIFSTLNLKSIELCKNEELIVDLSNKVGGDKTKIFNSTKEINDQRLIILQNDNNELIKGRIELLKSYNELLIKYKEIAEPKKTQINLEDFNKIQSSFTPSNIPPINKPVGGTPKDILNTLKFMLKVESYGDILITVHKLLKVLSSIPQMESFIKQVCKAVLSIEEATSTEIDSVIPTIIKWREEIPTLENQLRHYKEIIEKLQNICGEEDPNKLTEVIEGPYFLAWKMRPYIAVFSFLFRKSKLY